MMTSLQALKWKFYYGESPEAPSSEDEAYFKARPQGYTRDEITERKEKQKSLEKFESERFDDTVRILRKATHRGIAPRSVRPRVGTQIVASYLAKGLDGNVVIEKKEDIWTLGAGRSALLAIIENYLEKMRRGEVISVTCNDPAAESSMLVIEIELHAICDIRRLAPVALNPWCNLTSKSTYVEKMRLVSSQDKETVARRPRWGDTVVVRYCDQVMMKDDVVTHLNEIKFNHGPERIEIGKGVAVEGLEIGLMAMKVGEVALLSWTGEYRWNEIEALKNASLDDDTEIRIILRLDAIESPEVPENSALEAEAEATEYKRRGAALYSAKRFRRAEALFTRGLLCLDHCTSFDEAGRIRTEESLVVPLFLNVAQCARKRESFKDEENLISKALLVKRQQKEDHAFRAKVYVRRANARIDLGDKTGAKDDLRLANEAARLIQAPDNAVFLADIRRVLHRLKHYKPTQSKLLVNAAKVLQKRDTSETADTIENNNPTPAQEKLGLLYEKEIDDRLKASKPWLHDPNYNHKEHAPRKPVEMLPPVLKEDDLKSEYKKIDENEEEMEKIRRSMEQSYIMRQMYDTNGTGRRGKQPINGSESSNMMNGGMF